MTAELEGDTAVNGWQTLRGVGIAVSGAKEPARDKRLE